jgi:hypothetical protein
LTLGYTTIITPILPKCAEELEHYLRKNVEPRFDPVIATRHHRGGKGSSDSIIRCQSSFRFDQIKGLHFCSMVILPGVNQSDSSCLVFEATFDGPREEFLDDLLRVELKGIHAIYKNCAGYPESGLAVPDLIKEYLIRHDAGAQAFYSGSPGRSVAQINGEKQIRDQIASSLCKLHSKTDAPTTFLGVQRELQREVIRKRPENRWAEQPAVVPWEVAQRTVVAGATVLALLAAACGVGALALLLCGKGFADVRQWVVSLMICAQDYGGALMSSEFLRPVAYVVGELQLPNPLPLMSLIVVWLFLRGVELIFENEDPRVARFYRRYIVYGSVILRCVLVVLLVGFAVLWLDPTLVKTSVRSAPTLRVSLLALSAAALTWLLLRYWATSLKLVIQFQELTPRRESRRRCLLETAQFAMVVVAVWALLIVGLHVPDSITQALGTLVRFLLVLTIYTLIGVLTAYVLGLVLFLLVKGLELADRRRFAPATELITKGLNKASVYGREEGGVNRYQNHLASLTYVKPGSLRAWSLWLTLLVIGLLSRFWFNLGQLGGIRTILAARFVLIDGGRRLLFLSNYEGGWDSYLDEFIDMGAVKGLNAIWSNTFIKTANSKRGYAFPETKFYFWKGAQAEQPFKAYVRQSQIETIVWYSAYPTLSIININTSTDLRQALFKPLASCELDSVLLNAGL